MKIILTSILFAFIIPVSSMAQIVVEPYEKQIKMNINDISKLPILRATSKSGEVKTTFTDQTFSGGCLGTLVRTYEFSDSQGNKTTADLYVSLEDTDAPIFTNVPADVVVEKNLIPMVTSPNASDNSKLEVEVTFAENREGKVITRIWTSTDVCGNQAIATQRITIK